MVLTGPLDLQFGAVYDSMCGLVGVPAALRCRRGRLVVLFDGFSGSLYAKVLLLEFFFGQSVLRNLGRKEEQDTLKMEKYVSRHVTSVMRLLTNVSFSHRHNIITYNGPFSLGWTLQ